MNLALSSLLLLIQIAATQPTASPRGCESLAQATLPETTITLAQTVGGGEFPQAGDKSAGPVSPGAIRNLPPFCRVAATLAPSSDSEIRVELWMPISGWNGKFMGVGNGGWAGSISYGQMGDPLRRGYAVASTDTGHAGATGDGRFALGHPEKLVDFGYRSVHAMTTTAKALVATFYGVKPRWSYWVGGSTGGKQGLTEAQRYPDDYDGIVAGAPVMYWSRVMPHLIWLSRATHDDPAGFIPPKHYPLIHRAVLEACDARDGLRDSLVSDPAHCQFDPAVLLCSPGNDAVKDADCLTAPQVEAVKKIYGPVLNARTKTLISPGLLPGSEPGWTPAVGGERPFQIPDDYFKYVVFKSPEWDFHTMDFDRDVSASDAIARPVLDATDPDLRKFAGRGGKLLVYHGWGDQLITPRNTLDYYENVVKTMGPSQTQGFLRVFMVPGMSHQAPSPSGPIAFDLLPALEQWVEHGEAPARIVVSYMNGGKVERTRPLCPYPQMAVHSGTGSPDEASTFTCKAP
jgi:feruloyl esterase